jgi:hypothetical protein
MRSGRGARRFGGGCCAGGGADSFLAVKGR